MPLDEAQRYHPRAHRPLAGLYLRARRGMYVEFVRHCQPTPNSTILDVGPLVADDEPRQANVSGAIRVSATYSMPPRSSPSRTTPLTSPTPMRSLNTSGTMRPA
jgi:hypothetical protein